MQEKSTFRQRWFPTIGDAEDLMKERYDRKDNSASSKFPVIDLFGRWSRTLFLTGAIIWGAYQGIGNYVKTGDSVYNGTVTSFGREGLIFDTWEGSFAIGGDQRSVSWNFSLDEQMDEAKKDDLVTKLMVAANTRMPVRVHGQKYMATFPWRADTRYLIDSIEVILQ